MKATIITNVRSLFARHAVACAPQFLTALFLKRPNHHRDMATQKDASPRPHPSRSARCSSFAVCLTSMIPQQYAQGFIFGDALQWPDAYWAGANSSARQGIFDEAIGIVHVVGDKGMPNEDVQLCNVLCLAKRTSTGFSQNYLEPSG